MLGQASVPLVGIVDTAVIGRTGDATALAGVALGATIITLVFWTFGFLRMGMTGLTAQAHGSGDKPEVEALLLRALDVPRVRERGARRECNLGERPRVDRRIVASLPSYRAMPPRY